MKKLSLLIITVCLSLISCDVETSKNGDLDGLWQLRTIEKLKSGEKTDGRQNAVRWSFQADMLMIDAETNLPFYEIVCRFKHEGRALRVTNPHFSGRFVEEVNDDPAVDNPEDLKIYGLYKLDESFKILELNSDNMILESDSVRLQFKKY